MTTAPGGRRTRLPLSALLGASIVSYVGSQVTTLAIPWFVLETTGSATKTGLAAFAGLVGIVLATFLGGPAVDRLGLKRSSVLADLLGGATIALIPLLDRTVGLSFGPFLGLVFLAALVEAPGNTARTAFLPEIAAVAGVGLERANGLFQIVGALPILLGPPLGGVLIAAFGASNVLWVDAATFAVSAAVVAIAIPKPAHARVATGDYLAEVREGWGFLRAHAVIRALVVVGAVVNFLFEPVAVVLFPVYARAHFGDAGHLGVMLGAFGAGALAGAGAFTVLGERLPRRPVLLAGFLLGGLPLWVLATTPALGLIVVANVVAGVVAGPIQPLVATVIQEHVPAALRGRVFGVVTALTLIATPLSTLVAGVAVDAFGLRAVILAIAACFFALAVAVALIPTFRTLAPPSEAEV